MKSFAFRILLLIIFNTIFIGLFYLLFPVVGEVVFALSSLASLAGGLLFGIGMTLASGCANKTLIRVGGGNLKSLMVLVVASFFAYLMAKTEFYGELNSELVKM